MSREAAEILKNALALPVEARAAIADSLLDSLDQEIDPNAEDEWRREIQRRAAELKSGAVTESWPDIRARLMARLRDER